MKIVSRPKKKVIIQFREFERPKKGAMKLSQSRTMTLHDIDLKTVYERVRGTIADMGPAEDAQS